MRKRMRKAPVEANSGPPVTLSRTQARYLSALANSFQSNRQPRVAMTKPADGWQHKLRTCPNCFKKFLPTKWWQRFCPETETENGKKSCRLEFHRTGQVSLEKFRHYIDTRTKAAQKEILERVARLAGEIENISAQLERHVEQFDKRTRDLEEYRRRQQAI